MDKLEVVPSLLSADFSVLSQELEKVKAAGCIRLHLDVMDGHFVPNLTIGPVVIRSLRKKTDLLFDTHLMIEHPEDFIKPFYEAGSDCITVHKEACVDFEKTIRAIKNCGIDAGVSLRPKTPVESLRGALRDVDFVLVMSVEPGFGGQAYIEGSEEKVRQVRVLLREEGRNIPIGIDGGINPKTAALAAAAGATRLIAGNAVFGGDVIGNVKALWESARRAAA